MSSQTTTLPCDMPDSIDRKLRARKLKREQKKLRAVLMSEDVDYNNNIDSGNSDSDNDSVYSLDLDYIPGFVKNRPAVENGGPQEPEVFDIHSYLVRKRLLIDALCSPFNSVWRDIDVPFIEDRVEVSKKLEMTRIGTQSFAYSWIGKFSIKNRTSLNMIYAVKSLKRHAVFIHPDSNWIGPEETCDILVHIGDSYIKDFFNNGLIKVVTAPIYHEWMLADGPKILKKHWQTPGGIIPVFEELGQYSFEFHEIKNIYSSEYNLMDNWTLFDGLYTGQKSIMATSSSDEMKFPDINKIPQRPTIRNEYWTEVYRCIKNYEAARAAMQTGAIKKIEVERKKKRFRFGINIDSSCIISALAVFAYFGMTLMTYLNLSEL